MLGIVSGTRADAVRAFALRTCEGAVQQAAFLSIGHSEPVRLSGVGISIVIETALVLKMEIATPVLELARNDGEFGIRNDGE